MAETEETEETVAEENEGYLSEKELQVDFYVCNIKFTLERSIIV